ncbi:MAG TPA: hypothetical protein VMI54_17815 [Polyangiaceae bacterium]|nr:hypothetical protein [Polyangiaceae bacterium]
MSPRIQSIVSQFVEDLTLAIQEEGAAAFKAAIGSGGGTASSSRATRSNSGPRAAAPRRSKGAKRSPGELETLTKSLLAAIKKAPGQRIEQIGKSLGAATKDLALPVKKLIAEKKISTKGQRRATAYFPK